MHGCKQPRTQKEGTQYTLVVIVKNLRSDKRKKGHCLVDFVSQIQRESILSNEGIAQIWACCTRNPSPCLCTLQRDFCAFTSAYFSASMLWILVPAILVVLGPTQRSFAISIRNPDTQHFLNLVTQTEIVQGCQRSYLMSWVALCFVSTLSLCSIPVYTPHNPTLFMPAFQLVS